MDAGRDAAGKPKAFLSGFGQGVLTFGVGHGLFGGLAGKEGLLGITTEQSSKFGSAAYFGKAVAHGVVGGAFSTIRGGSFASGFLAAGFSSAVAPFGPDPLTQLWKGAAFSAAVGGVGSVLGGGKFADGAVTGAFTYLFNEAIQQKSQNGSTASGRPRYHETRNQAESAAIDQIASLTAQTGNEYSTIVFYDPERAQDGLYAYSYSEPVEGEPDRVTITGDIPVTARPLSHFHSHDTPSIPDNGYVGLDGNLAYGSIPAYVVGLDRKACRIRSTGYNC